MRENRDKTVDILRGFGIVLMIMGHIKIGAQPYDQYFSIWYHGFHMPLFYVVSGYFFVRSNVDEGDFIFRKARTLLVPYLFWGIFHIIYSFLEGGGEAGVLYSNIINLLVNPTVAGVPIAGALWFLPALFWINVIYFFMSKFIRNNRMLFLASLVVGVCGMVAGRRGVHLPMAIDVALVGVAFFATGSLLREMGDGRIKEHIFHMKWYVFMVLLIVVNCLLFYNGEVNFRSGVYENFLITYANAVISTILLWNVARVMMTKFTKGLPCMFKESMISIGQNSIIYLCLNQWMVKCIRPVYTSVGGDLFVWQCVVARGLTLVTVCFICHVVMRVMERSCRLRKYVGKG
ncbi:MAG: acyltransferase family protein [Lachnospiraceae bacterium]|nr:acyltransferase family protein [Lachnospiraceae bacterium]